MWPEVVGAQWWWPVVLETAMPGLSAVGALGFAVVAWLLGRRWLGRVSAAAIAVLFFGYAAATFQPVLAAGLTTDTVEIKPNEVRVLTWNTFGELTEPQEVADRILKSGAQIVSLPETTSESAEAIQLLLQKEGVTMWRATTSFDDNYDALSTSVLVDASLGEYRVASGDRPAEGLNTGKVPSIVAEPVDGEGPTIVAVHAVSPLRQLDVWKNDLLWLAELCERPNVILAGDFNAVIDHFGPIPGSGHFGDCIDAGVRAGAGGVGTWPAFLPHALGAQIDHVMVSPNWQVRQFQIFDHWPFGRTDHRAVLASVFLTQ